MAILRGFLAVFAAVLITGVIGAAYDYLRPGVPLDPVNMKFLYPWITGLSGGFGALIAVIVMASGAARPAEAKPAAKTRPQVAAKPAAKLAEPARKTAEPAKPAASSFDLSTEVPGMPVFDFDKAQRDLADKPEDIE